MGIQMDGAVSDDGISEAEINLTIALKLQNLLEQSGATVILTRSDENGIYDVDKTTLKQKKVSDIRNRVKIGNSSSADIFVSIHLNKIPQEQYSGWQTFFKKDNEQGEKLATAIQESLKEAVGKEEISEEELTATLLEAYEVDEETARKTWRRCLPNGEKSGCWPNRTELWI